MTTTNATTIETRTIGAGRIMTMVHVTVDGARVTVTFPSHWRRSLGAVATFVAWDCQVEVNVPASAARQSVARIAPRLARMALQKVQ